MPDPVDIGTTDAAPVTVVGAADDDTYVVVGLERDDQRDELMRRWPPFGLQLHAVAPSDAVERRVHVPVDGQVTVDGVMTEGGWDRVESELALFATERLRHIVTVHAAVIETEVGALIVPGRSGVGKTRLCVAAHAAGLRVRSDEYALVDPHTADVRGWPRPMRVRSATGAHRVPIGEHDPQPLRVALVAVVEFDPHGPGLRTATAGEVAMGLLANTVCAQRDPQRSFAAALAVSAVAPGVTGTRRDATDALHELVRLARGDR